MLLDGIQNENGNLEEVSQESVESKIFIETFNYSKSRIHKEKAKVKVYMGLMNNKF